LKELEYQSIIKVIKKLTSPFICLSCNNEQKLRLHRWYNIGITFKREIIKYFPFGDTSRFLSLFSLNIKKDKLFLSPNGKHS